jgi:asparagine synthase (glutamine-hydrolysing)
MMCGIAGIYNLERESSSLMSGSITKMYEALLHRGPDDYGIYESPDKRLYLAHTRLSIIDVSPRGHQPMSDKGAGVWISYNGQIYNYRQLQSELKMKGHEFNSQSDTEVVLHGYKEWGIEGLLKRLRGMFAFVIYDCRHQDANNAPKIFLARDRFGIKPLYYYYDKGVLIFSSEVNSITRSRLIPWEENPEAEIAFLVFGHLPSPLTTIKNVFSLAPATYLSIENSNMKLVKYYDLLGSFSGNKIKDYGRAQKDFLSLLSETVKLHLLSDVPLGVFLSGGIDSSALVALASKAHPAPISTLSVVFNERKYSELPFQRLVSEQYHTRHIEMCVTESDFFKEMENIFHAIDQPTVDGVNTYFVSQAAKHAGLKVMLSGAGGDEIFCGYPSFKQIALLRAVRHAPDFLKKAAGFAAIFDYKWKKFRYLLNKDDLYFYLAFRGLFIPEDVALILGKSVKEVEDTLTKVMLSIPRRQLSRLDPTDWLTFMEINYYLQNQLLKDTDFMSMYHAVETRVPFLDHILLDYVASLDPHLKFSRKVSKPLLVKAMSNMLPEKILFRKKRGFIFPFDYWLKKGGYDFFHNKIKKINLQQKYRDDIWRKFQQGRLHWSRIWALIVMSVRR